MIKEIIQVKSNDEVISYEKLSIADYKGVDGERALTHSFVMDVLRKIMGRTLTLIDASIVEKQQNKAIKDVIRGIMSDEMEFAAEWAFDQEKICRMAEEHFAGQSDEDVMKNAVSIEEALGVNRQAL